MFGSAVRKNLYKKIAEALVSVIPVTLLVVVLNFTPLVDFSGAEIAVLAVSSLAMIFGIGLFNTGADLAMTPMGEHIGVSLSKTRSKALLFSVVFATGFLITVAEPDLSVLASQVKEMIDGTLLIILIGAGVGVFLVVSIVKIVTRKPLPMLLMFFYLVLFALIALVVISGNPDFAALAFDSGGVTTGPITVPFIMALGVGISASIGGRNAEENSFGLIALASVGPVLAVALLGLLSKGGVTYRIPDYSASSKLGDAFLPTVGRVACEVGLALGLIVAAFAAFQFFFLRLPKKKLGQFAVGIVYTFTGLVTFLSAVTVGFMPIGYKLGVCLAESSPTALVAISFVLGAVTVLAEPAVHVLNRQVEDVTDGRIKKASMTVALSVGVGLSIGLSVLRICFDFSILYYLIPGYILSLGLSLFVPGVYTGVAFDSGGVASGPLTSGFVLPFAVGACVVLQGEGKVMADAFGVVAMVAMTPLITIQTLGFKAIVTRRVKRRLAMKRILLSDDEQIIDFL